MRARLFTLAALTATGLLVTAGPALAAPPPNDAQASAQALTLPADVVGTTVESTVEPTEPPGSCGGARGTAWYTFTATGAERVVARLQAAGDLDAQVTVFLRQRSQTQQVDCDATDANGLAQVSFTTRAGAGYLIRVEQRLNSVAGTFRLNVFRPQPAPRGPGARLAAGGARGVVDSAENIADAYSARLRAGQSYRVNLAASGDQCTSLAIYSPGTRDFSEADSVRRAPCSGYVLFTPDRGGTYSVVVASAPRSHVRQPYRLRVAGAGLDDTSPGRELSNFARVRGALNAGDADVVDLYRFDVTSSSELTLSLATRGDPEFDLVLLNDRGRRISCSCSDSGSLELQRRLRRGRYFAAVRARRGAQGSYTLRRVSRTITRTSVSLGSGDGQARPGSAVTIGVRVRPAVNGPVTIVIERFDPLEGWQFLRRAHVRASSGRASVTFRPPGAGRYRARASFDGTLGAAGSQSGLSSVLVAGPLRQ
ncbi:MAG: hypothetical protein QOH46_1994 [Solirubrobacteraceae bacterium]|jgi:hypothetical protein|nr:hypothetical protein [Solirubrobacteraceae bacterium]